VTGWLCTSASCAVEVGNLLAYRDDNDLTTTYTTWLAPCSATSSTRSSRGPSDAQRHPPVPNTMPNESDDCRCPPRGDLAALPGLNAGFAGNPPTAADPFRGDLVDRDQDLVPLCCTVREATCRAPISFSRPIAARSPTPLSADGCAPSADRAA
jgi:hypothetical protein